MYNSAIFGSSVALHGQNAVVFGRALSASEETPTDVDAQPANLRPSLTSFANLRKLLLLPFSSDKRRVWVDGDNGEKHRFDYPRKFSTCKNKKATSIRLFRSEKPVATPLCPQSCQEVADSLVSAATKKGWYSCSVAFAGKHKFWAPPLNEWLCEADFHKALGKAFSNPMLARDRHRKREVRQKKFFAENGNGAVSTGISESNMSVQVVEVLKKFSQDHKDFMHAMISSQKRSRDDEDDTNAKDDSDEGSLEPAAHSSKKHRVV